MSDAAPRHILALAPNWLGDAVMCTPALRALRRRFPEAELTVAGGPAVCAVLDGLSFIDRGVTLPPRAGLAGMARLRAALAPHARDLCVVFPHSFRAALLARILGARRRAGYARGGRSALLTVAVPPHRENGAITPIYMAFEYLNLVRALGCEDDGAGLELHADPAEIEAVRERTRGDGPLIALAPGAAFGPSKRWPPDRYARTAELLAERAGVRCMLLWGPGEEDTRDAVRNACRVPLLNPYGGPPGIARLKAAIAASDLLVGNDSGPRHIAVAFRKPVICIMGPTSPRYTESPWERGRVLRIDVDCGPCQKPVCRTDHRCMLGIAPETVADSALEFLR